MWPFNCRIDLFVVVTCWLHLLSWSATPVFGQVMCTKRISSCQCQTKSGKYIDLAPLASKTDFRFKQTKAFPSSNWFYSYNPCYGFKCEGADNVAVCQNDNAQTVTFALGTQDSAKFGYDLKNGLNLQYTSSHTSTTRTALVKLLCSQTDVDTFLPLDDGVPDGTGAYIYSSSLTSKHACEVDSLPDSLGGGGGMSPGDILLIIFFVGIIVYLAVGFAINFFVLKKPLGLEAVPNANVWLALFGFIRDGAVFCWDRIRQLFTLRRAGYGTVE